MKIISNTQVNTYNLCTQMHRYMYDEEIGPKFLPNPLYRGVVGHTALEAYYLVLMEGGTVDQALAAGLDVIRKELTKVVTETPGAYDRIELLAQLDAVLRAYAAYYRVEPFKVLAVEKIYTAPIVVDELAYGLVLDLLIELTTGQFRGDIEVVDHKFVYNFKTSDELELNAQLPKYIKATRDNGIPVARGMFNQIRYRMLKDPDPKKIFMRVPARTSKAAIETIWAEQRDTAIEIANNPAPPRRLLVDHVCKTCFYRQLCKAEMIGQDTTTMRDTLFQKRERPLKNIMGED